jgi:hypothetical protein
MKQVLFGVCAVGLLVSAAGARGQGPTDQDKAAVRQAAFDYAEGYLEGSADRMERAVHPAIVKRGAVTRPGSGPILMPMNAETLVESARMNASRPTPPDKRNISFELLDIRENVASARIFTSQFNDYLHLVKQDGRWRIANVLWQPPAPTGAANAEADKAAVTQVMKDYLDAFAASDPARIERLTHPEAATRIFRAGPTGKLFIMDGNRDGMVGAVRAKQAPPLQPATFAMTDTYDTIASVALTSPAITSYWHLVKQNDQWRVLNCLVVPPAQPGKDSRLP